MKDFSTTKDKPLDSNSLKLIAIIAMTIDHVTWMLFPGYSTSPIAVVLHVIGRLTCPIMCYFIAEGFHYTHDVKKYTTRLFLFALISHVPYVLNSMTFVDWKSFIPGYYGSFLNQTSVMWSLAWGLVMLRINASQKLGSWAKVGLVLVCCLLAFPSDWSCIASLCVLSIGANRGNPKGPSSMWPYMPPSTSLHWTRSMASFSLAWFWQFLFLPSTTASAAAIPKPTRLSNGSSTSSILYTYWS